MKRTIFTLLSLLVFLPWLHAADKEGGIIGTGIIGEVTGLSEFEVSGMEFSFADKIRVAGLSNVEDLQMGMTVAVRAERRGDDWFATDVIRISLLTGPVTSDSEVMGIPVIGDLPTEGRVRIDGFWSGKGVVATRVDIVPDGQDLIIGSLGQITRVIDLDLTDGGSVKPDGQEPVSVIGMYKDGTFAAQSIKRGLFNGSEPNLIMAEGYLSEPDDNGDLNLIGTGVRIAADQISPEETKRKSIRCAFNGRMDFELNEIEMPQRETVLALCANLPR